MPNISKLTDSIFKELKKLAKEGYNLTEISERLGFKRQTINYWVKKFKISANKKTTREGWLKQKEFLKICTDAVNNGVKIKLNHILRKLDLHPDTAQKLFKENPTLRQAIRTKKQAIIEDKALPLEEAQSRLPNREDKVVGFKDGKYEILAPDGFSYFKTSAKLYQGDPRGKSGSKIEIGEIKEKLAQLGYSLIESSYTIKKKRLQAVHKKCGKVRTNRFSNFISQECPVCSNNGTSVAEQQIDSWVQSLGLHTEKYRFKGKTKGKEIDIFIPSLNLGIEYCGLYWHSEEFKNKNYHYEKMKACEEKGIRLITIFEDEWVNRERQVKNFLKSVLSICNNRIYARKCTVEPIDKKIARDFLKDTHIQASAPHTIAIGLKYGAELVGVVTGHKHHRQGQDSFVLNRLAFKDGVQVVGGASKLIKLLVKYAKEAGYGEIVSWSDNRWSQGGVYKKTGFTFDSELSPDYSYVLPNYTRQAKQANTKRKLLAKGAIGSMNNTESQLAKTLNYKRIWDCGKKRWLIIL